MQNCKMEELWDRGAVEWGNCGIGGYCGMGELWGKGAVGMVPSVLFSAVLGNAEHLDWSTSRMLSACSPAA